MHSALSFNFQVVELGGSMLQKYDAQTLSYIPNRLVTPLVLQPRLIVSDPDGTIATADYTTQMVNVSWVVTLITPGTIPTLENLSPTWQNYSVDPVTKALTLRRNCSPSQTIKITFLGQYIDPRRNEVFDFRWDRDSSTETQTDLNITLDKGQWPGRVRLIPMRHWGQFSIPVQLKNGTDDIPDNRATYQWQWWNAATRSFNEDFSEQAWLVRGEQTKEITVDQNFIQDVTLRVKAVPYGNNNMARYFVTRLKRWYGQFDYDVEFLRGKYIFHNSNTVVLEAWVKNAKGLISNPCKYFDMELFFAIGTGDFESVGYGEEAIIVRNDLQGGQPQAGVLLRELSAYCAICTDGGLPICQDNGTPIFAQFPTKSRQV